MRKRLLELVQLVLNVMVEMLQFALNIMGVVMNMLKMNLKRVLARYAFNTLPEVNQ